MICKDAELCFVSPVDKKPSSEAVAEYLEGRKKYEELRKQKKKKGSKREEQVNHLLYGKHHIWIQIGDSQVLSYCIDYV